MIVSFRSKALKLFWTKGDASKLPPDHIERVAEALAVLNRARKAEDMNLPGFRFHELKGKRSGTYSITVTANWRITFEFEDQDAKVLDYEDYH